MEARYRFYKGEDACPFDRAMDNAKFVFWHEERIHAGMDDEAKARFVEMLKDAVAEGRVHGDLANADIPIEERAVLFFIDLHYGKMNPYGHDYVDWYSYFA